VFKKPIVESPTKDDMTENDLLFTLDVKRQYENGVYTFAGDVQVPTPCHNISSEMIPMENNEYALVLKTIIPAQDVMCAQVITSKEYKVSFEASQNVVVRAFVDDVEYKVNNFDIPEGFNIDEFDLKIKG